MEESRTKNAVKNVNSGIIVQVLNKVLAFVVRTIFIQMLNKEYLGINGLFGNVLTILSFAELGIGTAIIFSMYKPIAENNIEKIKSLMKLYRKSYNTIGVVIFVLGLCVIPFFGIIIRDVPNVRENLILIYILYLTDSASSYFFSYKKSIICAYQKQSIINRIDSVIYVIKSILQVVFLIILRNYIVYLSIQISSTIIENIIISCKADKMYPYLKDKNAKNLNKSESKKIFGNVKSIIVYKFGGVVMSGTDNILISSLVGVGMVRIMFQLYFDNRLSKINFIFCDKWCYCQCWEFKCYWK